MFVSDTASVDTECIEDSVASVACTSKPDLDQNRPYAVQSMEREEFVMRLDRSPVGKDLLSAIVSRLCQTEQLPAPLSIKDCWKDNKGIKMHRGKAVSVRARTTCKHCRPKAIALVRPRVKLAWPTATTRSPKRFVAFELRKRGEVTYRTAFSRKARDW